MDRSRKRRGRRTTQGTPSTTEERLIEAALSCVRTHGLAGATSRQIAVAAGVNLEAITYHFGSKDTLIGEALSRAIQRWLAPALEQLRAPAAPATRLLGAAAAFRTAYEDARETLPAYFEAVAAASRSPVVHRRLTALLDEIRRYLAGEIQALRAQEFLPRWVEPDAMAALLVAMLDGIALHAMLDPEAVNPDALLAQAVQLLLAARTPSGS